MNANDLRVQKTKKCIEDTFYLLLKEKSLPKITVTELAARAKINKGTFYRHYLDIYDLYLQTTQKNINAFFDTLDYYYLFFENPKEFHDRFRIDTENHHLTSKQYHFKAYEAKTDQIWLTELKKRILTAAPPALVSSLDQKHILWLQMILDSDLNAFKAWPDQYPLIEEITASNIERFKASVFKSNVI